MLKRANYVGEKVPTKPAGPKVDPRSAPQKRKAIPIPVGAVVKSIPSKPAKGKGV